MIRDRLIFEDGPTLVAGLYRSRWIWGGVDPRPINVFRLYRREFEMERVPETAELLAFAEFRYKLYVNGHFVQTGPTPCQPAQRLLDRHDVCPFLREHGRTAGSRSSWRGIHKAG